MFGSRAALTVAAGWVFFLGCSGAMSQPPSSQTTSAAPATVKRVTTAIQGDPVALFPGLGLNPSYVRGSDALGELVHVGASTISRGGALVPRLAEAVPSVENGLWKVTSDGRMETTWKLRAGAFWHDGTPVTAADFVFSTVVGLDPELALARHAAYDSVDRVDAPDASTVVVHWKKINIDAGSMFGAFALPLPAHKVRGTFEQTKAAFLDSPAWGSDLVGTGPFTVGEWVRGSHVVLKANHRFVLGRPNLDEMVVKFITDDNTMLANVLAGAVELTLGRNLSLEQGAILRQQWKDGRVEVERANEIHLWPQFIGANPAIVGDVRFRKALVHAIDRQQLVDSIQYGLTTIAHSWIEDEPEYAELAPRIVKYDYNPRRATEMIRALGYEAAPDGIFRDAAGLRLSVEIRTSAGDDVREKTLFAVVDYWQKAGVAAEPNVVPAQLATDREYRATFPAFELGRQGSDPSAFDAITTPQVRQAPRFTGSNYPRYHNPDYDALYERFAATIPRRERMSIAGDIVHHMTDLLPVMGLFFSTEPTAIANRLVGVNSRSRGSTQTWNVHEWDVKA